MTLIIYLLRVICLPRYEYQIYRKANSDSVLHLFLYRRMETSFTSCFPPNHIIKYSIIKIEVVNAICSTHKPIVRQLKARKSDQNVIWGVYDFWKVIWTSTAPAEAQMMMNFLEEHNHFDRTVAMNSSCFSNLFH